MYSHLVSAVRLPELTVSPWYFYFPTATEPETWRRHNFPISSQKTPGTLRDVIGVRLRREFNRSFSVQSMIIIILILSSHLSWGSTQNSLHFSRYLWTSFDNCSCHPLGSLIKIQFIPDDVTKNTPYPWTKLNQSRKLQIELKVFLFP